MKFLYPKEIGNWAFPIKFQGDSAEMTTFSWTQPCCTSCWNGLNPGREAHRIVPEYAEEERCVHCGETTKSGIYVRVNPNEAKFPTLTK